MIECKPCGVQFRFEQGLEPPAEWEHYCQSQYAVDPEAPPAGWVLASEIPFETEEVKRQLKSAFPRGLRHLKLSEMERAVPLLKDLKWMMRRDEYRLLVGAISPLHVEMVKG